MRYAPPHVQAAPDLRDHRAVLPFRAYLSIDLPVEGDGNARARAAGQDLLRHLQRHPAFRRATGQRFRAKSKGRPERSARAGAEQNSPGHSAKLFSGPRALLPRRPRLLQESQQRYGRRHSSAAVAAERSRFLVGNRNANDAEARPYTEAPAQRQRCWRVQRRWASNQATVRRVRSRWSAGLAKWWPSCSYTTSWVLTPRGLGACQNS